MLPNILAMPIWFRDWIDLINRILRRWLNVLGTSLAGIAAQIVIAVLTAPKGGWFRRSTWTDWRHIDRKRLNQALRAMAAVWGFVFVICAVITLRHDQQHLLAMCTKLESQNKTLSDKLAASEKQDRCPSSGPRGLRKATESEITNRRRLVQNARNLATDILTYKSDIEINRPMVILSTSSAVLTERSLNAEDQFEKNPLLDFLRRFSGPIYQLERGFREQGIDSSQLETHIAQLVNTQMIRLVAVDLNGMALQLENNRR